MSPDKEESAENEFWNGLHPYKNRELKQMRSYETAINEIIVRLLVVFLLLEHLMTGIVVSQQRGET
ncbi:MAG: hypothetical protein WCJ47_10370 [Methanomicrobiales archaeon]